MGFGKKFCLVSILLILIVTVGICVKLWVFNGETSSEKKSSKFVSPSPLGIYQQAGVATNGPECSKIGSDILKKNGSAVDAAIAALLCEGVASLHSMGLGGGFFMTIWDAKKKTAEFLDARETAPGLANETMFEKNSSQSLIGGMAVAVPGELMGYWEAHQKYGKLTWKELFEPAIELAEKGNLINKYLENSLRGKEHYILAQPTLKEILIDPKTNRTYIEGDRLKRGVLAKTLRKLADSEDPVGLFYKGSMAEDLAREIKEFGGIITKDDLSNYKVNWTKPVELKIENRTVYSAPAPGSGPTLLFILNVLKGLVSVDVDEKVLWQRFIETFKWGYAKRTKLGDPAFVDINEMLETELLSHKYADKIRNLIEDDRSHYDPKYYGVNVSIPEDHGTAHVSVLAPDGSAVSVTSTINQVLGAKIRSRSTGIIFNDEMDDFSSPGQKNEFGLPPSPENFIRPYKRPMSSMAPTIVLGSDENVELVVGAAGGSKITSAIAAIMAFNFWKDYDIKEATDAFRLHHQLIPMMIQYEHHFPSDILHHLWRIGHNATRFEGIGSAVTVVSHSKGRVTANSDWRRLGTTSGF